jgi:penicillin-binding protein 2
MHAGIMRSCDVYFYTVGAKTGIDNLAFYGDIAGFGHLTGIDLPHETPGLMPSTQWKMRTQRQKWYAGETPSVAIGQGALTVTPLQLARATGGLAMGGTWYRPHLVKAAKDLKPVQWSLNPDSVKSVIDGMYGVVNEYGTGGRARLPNIEVCGKTGTAQLASNDFLQSSAKGRNMKDNAWFVGFAPRHNPEIVVVALFEHGEHGQFAAPIVRDVIKAYFDKKARMITMQQQKERLQAGLRLGLPAGPGPLAPDSRPPAPPEPPAPGPRPPL